MPTYKNSGSTVVEIEGIRIEPGQTVATNSFLETLPAGVTKTLNTPHVNPVIYSKVITVTETVDLTSVLVGINGNYELNFFCSVGSVAIQLVDNTTTKNYLVAGERWNYPCLNRSVLGFIITITTGTVGVTATKI